MVSSDSRVSLPQLLPPLTTQCQHRFYAPWCGHCKTLKPAYEKAAESLEGLAQVAAVNCDDESNKAFCGSMGVQGFPTLKTVRPTLKIGKPIIVDYQGPRTAKGIVEAVKGIIPNYVKRVTDKDLEGWLKDSNETAKAILFSDKGTTSALIKVLAADFVGNMNFAQIRDKDAEAISAFGIITYPTLVVLPGGDAPAIVYEGEMKKAPMTEFLNKYAPFTTAFPPDSEPKKQKPITNKKDKKEEASSSSKSSSASSAFSQASASQASEEVSESAASATTLTVEEPDATTSPDPIVAPEDAPTPAPMPIAPPLTTLTTEAELQSRCLGPKTPTCVLALLPPSADTGSELGDVSNPALSSLSEIAEKHRLRRSHLFPFFAVSGSNPGAKSLRTSLGLKDDIEVVAVNGRRSWWRHFRSEKGFGMMEIEGWVDAIRLGEGKKEKLPEGLVVEMVEKTSEEKLMEEEPLEITLGHYPVGGPKTAAPENPTEKEDDFKHGEL